MPKKAKETKEEIPVKNTKKDTNKSVAKVIANTTKNANITHVSDSKPSGTKTAKKSVKSNKDLNKEIVKEAKSTTKLKKSSSVSNTLSKTSKTNKPKKVELKSVSNEETKSVKIDKPKKAVKATKSNDNTETKSTKISKTDKTKKSTKSVKSNVNIETKPTKISKTDKTKKSTKSVKSNADIETMPTKISKTDKTKKSTKSVKSNVDIETKPTKIAKTKKDTKSNLVSVIEYYDLPYRYNQTVVKVLAQTPSMLFVYWDISDSDRKNFEQYYGNDFFSKTKPVLIIHNETMNYSFEIEINDFANSWYLHVNDADCKYVIELGRRPLPHVSTVSANYIYISSSNEMTSPNNHILFEKFNPNVTYKNTKNGNTLTKDFSNIANYKNMQSIYNIYDLYKTIYKDDLFYEITNEDLTNPSSLSSSSFK